MDLVTLIGCDSKGRVGNAEMPWVEERIDEVGPNVDVVFVDWESIGVLAEIFAHDLKVLGRLIDCAGLESDDLGMTFCV